MGASLTVAAVAVLPVLVGLAVDYAIQFQSRVQEQLEAPGGAAVERPQLIARAASVAAPTLAAACAASAAAMLVLMLSPVPMVRGFGVLLAGGVVIALLCALSVGAAAIALSGERSRTAGSGDGRRAGGAAVALRAAWRGAGELLRENPLTRLVARVALVGSVRRPGRVLCLGLALAALGWGLDTQTSVQTDITKLVPQNRASLQNLNTLERVSGVGGEVDLMLTGKNLTTPATIEWMSAYQTAVLKRYGYSATRGCGRARICPAFSLPSLFEAQAAPGSGAAAAARHTQAYVNALLSAIPAYFSQEVISPDHRTATLAFGIRLMSLAQQQQLIDGMRSLLHPPRRRRARASSGCPCWQPAPPPRSPTRGGGWRRCWRGSRPSRWCCCSPSAATAGGRSCRSRRSCWRAAGRRSCCSRSACR